MRELPEKFFEIEKWLFDHKTEKYRKLFENLKVNCKVYQNNVLEFARESSYICLSPCDCDASICYVKTTTGYYAFDLANVVVEKMTDNVLKFSSILGREKRVFIAK